MKLHPKFNILDPFTYRVLCNYMTHEVQETSTTKLKTALNDLKSAYKQYSDNSKAENLSTEAKIWIIEHELKLRSKTQIECILSKQAHKPKKYFLEKICPASEHPKNANYFDTCYLENGFLIDIYKTPSGKFYGKPPRN